MLVLMNRGAHIVLGMTKGFYPGYTREIHEIYRYAMRPNHARHPVMPPKRPDGK